MSAIEDLLFRHLGTHAVKKLLLSPRGLTLSVAPWQDLTNEAQAEFRLVNIRFIEADCGNNPTFSQDDANLPWDIIRFDSHQVGPELWEFGLCCSEIQLGFTAPLPDIHFSTSNK